MSNVNSRKGNKEYVIEGPYPEGSTLFGSCVADRYQLVEYETPGGIVGGGFFNTLEEAEAERIRCIALDKDQS